MTNLKTEVEETKSEMKKYEELAEKAEYLADTLKVSSPLQPAVSSILIA